MPDEPSVAELGVLLGGAVLGDAARRVKSIRSLDEADGTSISFLSNPRYCARLQTTAAGCVIVAPQDAAAASRLPSAIVVDDPYRAYATLTRWWAQRTWVRPPAGVHPSAVVHPQARLHPTAHVGPLAVIGERADIGAGCDIGPHVVIEADVCIGDETRIGSRVHVGARCHVGRHGVLHPGVVIGADGFGFASHAGQWEKIEQLGAVRIGDDVEIGANTCIDRGALGDTVLGDGVKLDNLIQIGHNVQVGSHTAMAGCVGVAGSARIGARCTLGGGAIVLGHLDLADDVHVSAATVVTRSIAKPGHYSGVFPFDENASWEKNAATLRHLHEIRQRLRALEGRIA